MVDASVMFSDALGQRIGQIPEDFDEKGGNWRRLYYRRVPCRHQTWSSGQIRPTRRKCYRVPLWRRLRRWHQGRFQV